ncbi:MAG: enoyl-CoA hydratase/isomerase family protein [Actinobacteria bacterium]|nr:enoyl-CoA hydratase/isomerase family protein [Actinomycetota bacterium]
MTPPDEAPAEAPIEEQVTSSLDGGVATITINRPDIGNSLSFDMRDRLIELFEQASADLAVRCVVLTGAGDRHFCTGANLGGSSKSAAPARPEGAPDRAVGDAARIIRRGWQRLIGAILDCEKPVIARVNGTAAGGGAQLVLAADLAVMADDARFIEVFIRRGIIPDAGGAYLLPRSVGLKRAKEIMFFGDDVPAAEAERIGIVNRVVPRSDLDKAVSEWADRFTNLPTKAIGTIKGLLNRSFESSRGEAFEDEAVLQELNNATEDAREGMTSFVERREPDFKGW